MSLFKLIMLLVYFNGKYTPLSLPSVLEQPVKPGISKVLTALVNLKTGGADLASGRFIWSHIWAEVFGRKRSAFPDAAVGVFFLVFFFIPDKIWIYTKSAISCSNRN